MLLSSVGTPYDRAMFSRDSYHPVPRRKEPGESPVLGRGATLRRGVLPALVPATVLRVVGCFFDPPPTTLRVATYLRVLPWLGGTRSWCRLYRDLVLATLCLTAPALELHASDWPQLQHDAARTGRSPDEVAPPYRARWLWFGPAGTLRNRLSKPANADWKDDLVPGIGRSYPVPPSVPFTLAGLMQPIVHRGFVFVASQEGKAYAIREDDGVTAWETQLPAGVLATGAAAGGLVVFGTVQGELCALNITNGAPAWTAATGKSITGAPCIVDDSVYVANHGGSVFALHLPTGRTLWQSKALGAAVQGSLAANSNAVYVAAENLKVHRFGCERRKRHCSPPGLWPELPPRMAGHPRWPPLGADRTGLVRGERRGQR